MNEAPNIPVARQVQDPREPAKSTEVFIHRVCIQCNNVFRVPAERFDAKQCPNCHKG